MVVNLLIELPNVVESPAIGPDGQSRNDVAHSEQYNNGLW